MREVGSDNLIAGCRENFVIVLVVLAFVFVFGGGALFFCLMSDMKPW